MIIDAHTHIFESGSGGMLNLPATADDLLRSMDSNKVEKAIVIPLPGVASNEFIGRECKRFEDRLYYLYTPEFNIPEETIERMRQFFDEYSPRGIKVHPRIQRVSIADTIVRETLNWIEGRDLPTVFDVFPFGQDFAEGYLQPEMYNNLAQEMRDLTIVLAHAGGHKVLEAFLAAKANANIILDVSFTLHYFAGSSVIDDLKFVCERLPEGRIMYGSDFPDVRMEESLNKALFITADLSLEKRQAFYANTAAHIFKL